MKLAFRLGLLAICFCAVTSSFAEGGDPAQGEKLSSTCMGCHGVKGFYNVYPSYRVPMLGGQSAKYIEREHSAGKLPRSKLTALDLFDVM